MRVATLLMAFVLCVSGATFAHAQTQAATTTSDYEQRITEALQAFEAGRWTEARSQFRRAHELDPTARTLRTIGMCSFNLGDYADAAQNLDAALNDTRKPLTAEQKAQVSDLIARANAKLARFRLRLSPEGATLLVDAAAPSRSAVGELLLEPGRHVLMFSAEGYVTQQRELSVEAGDRSLLEVQLQPSPSPVTTPPLAAEATPVVAIPSTADLAPTPAPAAAPTSTQATTANSGSATLTTLGYVSIGVGIAGIVGFAATGALALSVKGDLDDECPAKRCAPEHYDDVDSYDRWKTVSTVSLIGGGAFLALGSVLLLLDDDAPTSSEHAAADGGIIPLLGLGWAGVRGSL